MRRHIRHTSSETPGWIPQNGDKCCERGGAMNQPDARVNEILFGFFKEGGGVDGAP